MKAQDFRALVDELGDLTAQQRSAVLAALASKGTASEAIAMIENRFAADPVCGHCGSANFGTWGHASDLRRYKCKGCKRTFNALTGTPLAQLHRREAWLDYARCLVDRVSLRAAAELTGVCLQTSFRWRHRFLKAAKSKRPTAVSGIVEADETFILKSQKGARAVRGRKSRKRGGKAAKPGLSTDEHDAVLIVRDRAAYGAFAHANSILHIPIIASHGEHQYEGFHIQNVNAYTSRFKGWMAPFKGVASKYLASYLGWRRMIERDGDRLLPRHCLAEALG